MTTATSQPTTTEYRAQVTLPNRTISITASSQEDCINDINNLLGSKANFQQHGTSSWIFHDNYLRGEAPIGVIEAMRDFPVSLSVERTASQRLKATAGG